MLSEQHARALGKHAGDPIVLRTFTKDETDRCLLADQQAPDCEAVFASPGGPKIRARVAAVLRTGVDLRNRDDEVSLSYLTPAFHAAHPDLAVDYLALVRLRDHARATSS